jgi:2'-5' RNA ligase
MSAVETVRLFIALSVPPDVREKIKGAQEELRHALLHARIRWTQVEQFHLTLRFLGDVEAQRWRSLCESFATACRRFAPLKLRAAGLGCFPNARRPRVIWVGIEDATGRLAELQRMIQAATQDFTVEEAEPNFSGHVTLGRIKEIHRKETEVLARAIADAAQKSWGEWTAQHVEIFRSELSADGAKHVLAASVGLG